MFTEILPDFIDSWSCGFHFWDFIPIRHKIDHWRKQLSIVVLTKRRSENMQQIYRRTPMPKCDFSKVALQLYWNRTSTWVFSVNLLHIFRTPFLKNTSERLLLDYVLFPTSKMHLERKQWICYFDAMGLDFSITDYSLAWLIFKLIKRFTVIDIAPLTVLFCNCPLFCKCQLADL